MPPSLHAAPQSEWDAAVEANAAELRALKDDAAATAAAQRAEGNKLAELRGDLAAKASAMEALAEKRRGLAAEEEALRRR